MTTYSISSVTLDNAILETGQEIAWSLLISAATQSDTSLAGEYRAILATGLNAVAEAARSAYLAYCEPSAVVSSRGGAINAIGHGSWSVGPNPVLQSNYQAWDKLCRDIESAICD